MPQKKYLLFVASILITISCSNKDQFLSDGSALSVKDSFDLSVTKDTIEERPVLNDQNETPSAHFETKIPKLDTNIYYGVDFEGDTVIYTDGNKILTEGYLTGNFIEIQKGDYLHLTLKDSLEWYHSFFIFLKNDKKMEELWEEKYPPYKKKIRVHWKRENMYLEEARGKMLIYFITEMKILN